MKNYKNGLENKSSLYYNAKKVFYNKGYDKTTIQEIVTAAKTKLGMLNYYFISKENLAMEIFRDFANDVVLCIENQKENIPEYPEKNPLLVDMIGYRGYIEALRCNEHLTRFYVEITKLPLFSETLVNTREYFFDDILSKEPHSSQNPKLRNSAYYTYLKSATAGMECYLLKTIFEGKNSLLLEDAVDFYFEDYYNSLFKDAENIKKTIQQSREIIQHFHFSVSDDFSIELEII
ncbi:MAG: TetR/AcrR family transcriptional regulator [Eubacterium limosum]|nr:TetR/AcrR family transcriptional regulator [Eubacterium limosum]